MSEIPTYTKLVMITTNNNNKFYELKYDGGSTLTARWGRIENGNIATKQYPIRDYHSIYKEKLKKGYKDVTLYVSEKVNTVKQTDTTVEYVDILDNAVNSFITLMKKYTDGLVSKTYSVKAVNVTQKQVDDAQKIINEINALGSVSEDVINGKLIELYTVIPRYMSHVKNHILPAINLEKRLIQEQDNLDAMASQVAMLASESKEEKTETKPKHTLLDVMGLVMKKISPPKDVEYLVNQLSKSGKRIEHFFEVDKGKENQIYDNWVEKQNNKASRLLIHGTRCTSVIPILEQGLKVRPAGNFQFSGKVYGNGNYFSEVVSKSLNYTGYDSDKVLLVYEVHIGNPFVYNGWYSGNSFTLCYDELKKRGFDSTHVNAGNGLLNSEIIAYKEEQCRIKYIFWLK